MTGRSNHRFTVTSLEIGVNVQHEPNTSRVKLVVRDYGPACRNWNLRRSSVYRVTDARDRQSDGAGLDYRLWNG